jgi:hypothetical protein
MGGSRTMEKRGHHICQVGPYQVRQKVTRATESKYQGQMKTTPGSTEVSIYKSKNKLEGDFNSVAAAAQKIIEMLKSEGKDISNISKRVIQKYNLSL